MEIHSSYSGMNLSLTLEGHITGISEVAKIKSLVNANQGFTTLDLIIKDAFVIPSALIGYLIKIINADNKRVTIKASHNELKVLLSELKLDKVFEVR